MTASILRCIERDAPQDVAGLAAALHLHPNTVRKHLARLTTAGLVVDSPDRLGRAGRPRTVYRAADGAQAAVARVTAASGLQPEVDGPDVVIHHCPFDPSTFDGAVCIAHVQLVRDTAADHGASVRVELDPDGPPCRFHIEQGPRR